MAPVRGPFEPGGRAAEQAELPLPDRHGREEAAARGLLAVPAVAITHIDRRPVTS